MKIQHFPKDSSIWNRIYIVMLFCWTNDWNIFIMRRYPNKQMNKWIYFSETNYNRPIVAIESVIIFDIHPKIFHRGEHIDDDLNVFGIDKYAKKIDIILFRFLQEHSGWYCIRTKFSWCFYQHHNFSRVNLCFLTDILTFGIILNWTNDIQNITLYHFRTISSPLSTRIVNDIRNYIKEKNITVVRDRINTH